MFYFCGSNNERKREEVQEEGGREGWREKEGREGGRNKEGRQERRKREKVLVNVILIKRAHRLPE